MTSAGTPKVWRKSQRLSKYSAQKTVVDGIVFASKKEAKRYGELRLMQRAGLIRNLELQPKFPIIIKGTKCFTYIADFAYFDDHNRVIEDVKGMKTAMYRLKRKCVIAMYGVKILEI